MLLSQRYWYYYSPRYLGIDCYLFVGIFSVIAFAFGFASGILTMKRRLNILSMLGLGLLVDFAELMSIPSGGYATYNYNLGWNMGWLVNLGIPIFYLPILSIVFIVMSKSEFNNPSLQIHFPSLSKNMLNYILLLLGALMMVIGIPMSTYNKIAFVMGADSARVQPYLQAGILVIIFAAILIILAFSPIKKVGLLESIKKKAPKQ